jgi:thiamine pyrophosphokinase
LILLSRYPGKIFLESDNERLFVIDKHSKFSTNPGQQISLIPMNGPVTGVRTQGLKWELDGKTLDKQFIGISNEATKSQVSISVEKGDLLCCINF